MNIGNVGAFPGESQVNDLNIFPYWGNSVSDYPEFDKLIILYQDGNVVCELFKESDCTWIPESGHDFYTVNNKYKYESVT